MTMCFAQSCMALQPCCAASPIVAVSTDTASAETATNCAKLPLGGARLGGQWCKAGWAGATSGVGSGARQRRAFPPLSRGALSPRQRDVAVFTSGMDGATLSQLERK